MKLDKALPLLAAIAGVLLFPATAAAVSVPKLMTITVSCQSKDGANHTVHIVTEPDQPLFGHVGYRQRVDYTFRNAATQQAVTFSKTTFDRLPSFPLPQGTYELTIAFVTDSGSVRDSALVVYKGITVPQIVSTGGRGTGCGFA